ncbi:MAG: ATP-binding protein [Ruminiclostridium sp.]|mgnify:CR=1 FL=1|nr:ATP-binding protein [Ruminiclostridium sp.]
MKHRRHAVAGAIKEAFDNLPSGICFFDRKGLLVLCNRRMYALAFDIMGRDLQLLSELQEAMAVLPENSAAEKDGELFLVPDGTAWKITQSEVCGEDGKRYTQVVAADVTELHRNSVELAENNRKLEAIAERLRQITKNVASIAREEEILAMKMRVHDELGESLLALRTYCLHGFPAEKRGDLIDGWSESIRLLQDGIEKTDESDSYEELFEIAASVGIAIRQTGRLPQDTETVRLMTAAVRECVTNAVRHAEATEMYVVFVDAGASSEVHITNNGKIPAGDIIEGGGLSSLRRRIENAGGAMTVRSRPDFGLIIRLPSDMAEGKGRRV